MASVGMETTTIIGIDAATDDVRTAVARGIANGGEVRVEEVLGRWSADRVAAWIRSAGPRVLLAIDAPLGWPRDLARALGGHNAGRPLPVEANQLFRRETDRQLKRVVRKTPLDVGADRIARAAHAMLGKLDDLRLQVGGEHALPMQWVQGPPVVPSVIEVYPAATLMALGFEATGYKGRHAKDAAAEVRRDMVERFRSIGLGVADDVVAECIKSDDILDAALCVLAGAHFIAGACHGFEDDQRALVEVEGWIWVTRGEVSARAEATATAALRANR